MICPFARELFSSVKETATFTRLKQLVCIPDLQRRRLNSSGSGGCRFVRYGAWQDIDPLHLRDSAPSCRDLPNSASARSADSSLGRMGVKTTGSSASHAVRPRICWTTLRQQQPPGKVSRTGALSVSIDLPRSQASVSRKLGERISHCSSIPGFGGCLQSPEMS